MATKKKTTARKPAARKGVQPKISSEAVAAKTGKSWTQWFAILDREGGRKKSHQEIVAVLTKKYDVGSWWQQMVAVSYEQAKGLRARHEKSEGFQITRSKTIAASAGDVFEAWGNARKRAQWLPGSRLTIRKATENKSLRITWGDGTMIEVGFSSKGAGKTQIAVQHGKLATARAAAAQKLFWGDALDRLAQLVSA
jgi:uncharacterized protein YndB with AHSA1/START domain